MPAILARGPWPPDAVHASWLEEPFAPSEEQTRAADEAISELRERGSPSHDGLSGRLADYSSDDGVLELRIQPVRWSLRLIDGDACRSMAALCVTRDCEGRWLAGRRAGWVATWAGRWALGAGGAVDVGESPVETLRRELREEWSVDAEQVRGEALLLSPSGVVMFVGQAWLASGAESSIVPDHEHDEWAWWPAEVEQWPADASAPLRAMAQWLGA